MARPSAMTAVARVAVAAAERRLGTFEAIVAAAVGTAVPAEAATAPVSAAALVAVAVGVRLARPSAMTAVARVAVAAAERRLGTFEAMVAAAVGIEVAQVAA